MNAQHNLCPRTPPAKSLAVSASAIALISSTEILSTSLKHTACSVPCTYKSNVLLEKLECPSIEGVGASLFQTEIEITLFIGQ